jgi:CheY-like chemotaxis protein/signal transduction histidine kinase/HAMP domain-containing protein
MATTIGRTCPTDTFRPSGIEQGLIPWGDRRNFMKIGNFKIGTRLTIGFILVILLTLTVGLAALDKMNVLAGLVNEMYDHPLTVGYAVRDIRSEIDRMHDQVQRLLFATGATDQKEIRDNIDDAAIRVMDKFDLVKERFLGRKNDVIVAQKAFVDWKKKLDQAFEEVRDGTRDKLDRTFFLAHLKRTDHLQTKLQVMINFASGKAQSFLDTARHQQSRAKTTMVILLSGTLVLSLGVAWLISQSITPSLKLIVERMGDIARGDLRHDVRIDQRDEIGALAQSFREMQTGLRDKAEVAMAIATGDLSREVTVNGQDDHLGNALNKMTAALRSSKAKSDLQDWIKSGKNELHRIIAGQGDLEILAAEVLGFLATYLKAQIGTLYVLSDENLLTLYGSYATGPTETLDATIALGQGIVGQAAQGKKIISVSGLPQDYLRISSSLGESAPRHIIAVPLRFENKIQGVIELGSIDAFSEPELDFLNDASNSVAIAVNTVQSQNKRKALLSQTQQQAAQLQAQEEELRVANEELEGQTRSLIKSEELLKQQQEELRTINEELEEKNQYLEEQKLQIAQKNQTLEVTRKELELRARELEITSKFKSEFLANMSHELRTPLNSLLILSGDLQSNAKGNLDPDQVESAGVIQKSGMELLQLINEVLDLSKIEAGRMSLQVEDVDLPALAASIEQSFKHVAGQKDLQFKLDLMAHLPRTIRTDSQRLQQILKNLVSNALKFTEKGSVTVTFQRPAPDTNLTRSGLDPERCVAIGVTDTGIGIPLEKQMQIFEAFQQADGGTARKYGGTGLGLSISRELAKMLGGEIQLTSTPGQGSTFMLYLPLAFEAADTAADADTKGRRQARDGAAGTAPYDVQVRYALPEKIESIADDRETIGHGDRSILIIEDDREFAKILLAQCRSKGFKALVSSSGEQGLILAEKYLPDAVLLDIRLPGMSGCTVLNTLKKNHATRHIPVHVISVEESSLPIMQSGAVGFTTKPVNRRELEQAFENIEQVVAKKIKDLLIVEDNDQQRLAIAKLIGDADIHIVEAQNGADALAALKERSIDCMILDLGLPDMSGFELLNRMGEEKSLTMPPVIVYTGKDLTREDELALRKHAESIIIKGVKSADRLLDEVSLFLHKTVSAMPPNKREMIIQLHERDAVLSDKTILLVDDDMRNLFALSKILSEKGMKVLKAEDGEKALALLDTHPEIALVLLDIMMPVMDGYQTARQIRRQPRFYDLPIIALTAKALKDDRDKCIKAGANDYLAKPVDVDRLFSTLRVWLYRQTCVL